jgi:hypothetical protein
MTALIWAQGRQLMRLWRQWQTLLPLVAFVFVVLSAPIWVRSAQDLLKPLPNQQAFSLALALFISQPWVFVPQTFGSLFLPEWKLAQPIPARTMAVFLWASANMLYFSLTFVLLAAIVNASILLKGMANIAAIALSVTVIVLNACLGAALVSLKMTGWRTTWAFLCELWVMWVSALFVLAIILLTLYYFSGALRAAHIDWEKVIGWVETPVGTVVLLPLMPAYYSIKAAFDGVGAVSVFLTMFLAVFTAIMVWEALKFAAPFCEATFLHSEQRQRLTKMGAWDAAAQAITAKLAKSESGFGLKATSLLWLYWLDWKRRNSWAGELPALLVICSFGAVLFVIFGADFSNIGILSLALAMTLFSYRVFFFPHPPEWLKSQPILAREAVLILALPTALRASLWGLAILFAIALLSPEGIGIANSFAFFLALIALGFGIDFAAQALRASRWTNFQDFPWLASAIAIGLGGLMSLTLTDYWLLGLLLSWAACLVLYLWAKERWRTEP